MLSLTVCGLTFRRSHFDIDEIEAVRADARLPGSEGAMIKTLVVESDRLTASLPFLSGPAADWLAHFVTTLVTQDAQGATSST